MSLSQGTLYTFRRCPYAMRARLALKAASVDVEVREVVLRDKPDDFLKLSPKGTVPVLALANGQVLEESLDIMQWALARHDPDEWLRERERALGWVASIDGAFKEHLDRYKYATRFEEADPAAERDAADECLTPFEARLETMPFLGGEHADLADVAIFPFVRQFANVEPERFAERFPGLERWRGRWQCAPRFVAIMRKLAPWKTGDEVVLFSDAFAL